MGGIAGWIDYREPLTEYGSVLQKMSDTLKHRGPDAKGEYLAEHAALLHRRLAVIDPENGKQPMHKMIGGREYVMVYDGELYNADEIRQELKRYGYDFVSRSDTEVLLLSYIEWGEGCLKRLNGIFAFAVYDVTAEKLFMARDRAGVKPFFYHRYAGGFVFASEIKTLLEHPRVSRRVDKYGIAEVFLIGPGRTPGATAFLDIEELKPGWCAALDRSKFEKREYWRLEAQEHTDTMRNTIETLRFLLEDAVTRQLAADVPVCCLLSGDLDTSLLAMIATENQQEGGAQLTTYSLSFAEQRASAKPPCYLPDNDDTYIDLMAEELHTDHQTVMLDSQTITSALETATLARDLPGMADIDAILLLLFQEVKKTHTVVLSALGAEEIFGGYPWYTNPDLLSRADFPWGGNTKLKAELIAKKYLTFDPEAYIAARVADTVRHTPKTGQESELDARIKEITMLNVKWFMQTLLDSHDRLAMYHGLELRVPFCDHRIMQYAYNIPWEMKSYAGRDKGLLRKVFCERLPHEIAYRRRSGGPQSDPASLLAYCTKRIRQLLDDPNAPLLEIVQKPALESLLLTGSAQFSKPWYGQRMQFPQILAYMDMINTWLSAYRVDIQ